MILTIIAYPIRSFNPTVAIAAISIVNVSVVTAIVHDSIVLHPLSISTSFSTKSTPSSHIAVLTLTVSSKLNCSVSCEFSSCIDSISSYMTKFTIWRETLIAYCNVCTCAHKIKASPSRPTSYVRVLLSQMILCKVLKVDRIYRIRINSEMVFHICLSSCSNICVLFSCPIIIYSNVIPV